MKGRKINKVGRDTLTISLPKSWAEKNKIQRGMELGVQEIDDRLIIFSEYKKPREILINVGDYNTFLFSKLLNDIYMQDVDKITIRLDKLIIFDQEQNKSINFVDFISNLLSCYIGFEIVSQTEKAIVLQNLIKENEIKNISQIQVRTHSLYIDLVKQICDDLNKTSSNYDFSIKSYAQNIRKFIYYCLRIILCSNLETIIKIKWYGLYDSLDNTLYNIERITEMLRQLKNLRKEFKMVYIKIFELFIKYLEIKEEINLSIIDNLILERFSLLKKISKINLSPNEEKLLREARVFLNIHNDFITAHFYQIKS